MSVYKDPRSPYYGYDFQLGGHRFFGSTKAKSKREAEAIERTERERAKKHLAQLGTSSVSLRLDDVAGGYWREVGQHHAGSRNTWRQLEYLLKFFGKDRLLTDITGEDVGRLVAWRRGHTNRYGKLLSPFSVNDTTEQLKKLFVRVKATSKGVRFDHEPDWRAHWLAEPDERVRELVGDEDERIEAATREDYEPFFAFAKASGLRLNECLLRWSEVDWDARQIRKPGKGERLVTVPITATIRAILWPLRLQHPEFVFTYVAQRTVDKTIRGKRYQFTAGERYPLTYSGVSTAWRRLRQRAEVEGFRFHDFRHDFGSKLLRETGNLKLTQRAMNHRSIKSTLRYVHVLDSEVAEAMESVQKSRKKSRKIRLRKIS